MAPRKLDSDWDVFQARLPTFTAGVLERQTSYAISSKGSEGIQKKVSNGATTSTREMTAVGSAHSARVLEPMATEDMVTWVVEVSERRVFKVIVLEFFAQFLWYMFGPFAIPALIMIYGSTTALKNRFMWPNCRTRMGVFDSLAGLLMLSALTIFIVYRPEQTDYTEIILIVMIIVTRCMTIAVKYGFMPLPAWRRLNRTLVAVEQVKSLLLIATWKVPTKETARKYADLSRLTLFGPCHQDLKMKFLPWPRNADESQKISRVHGLAVRSCIAKQLRESPGSMDEHYNCDLPPSFKAEEMPPGFEEGSISVNQLYYWLLEVVLERERSSPIIRIAHVLPKLMGLVYCLLPSYARWRDGYPFFGEGASLAIVCLYVAPVVSASMPSFVFLQVAIMDGLRKLALMKACCALVSLRAVDRKMGLFGIPRKVAALGLLDFSDPQTVEGFRMLRALCREWGRFFSLRCIAFTEGFMILTLLIVTWMSVLIENKAYNLISRGLLTSVVGIMFMLSSLLLAHMTVGGAVNRALARQAYLLQSLRMQLEAEECQRVATEMKRTLQPVPLKPGLRIALRHCRVLVEAIDVDHMTNPVRLLGFYASLGLVATLYVVPVYVISRIIMLCHDRPYLCETG